MFWRFRYPSRINTFWKLFKVKRNSEKKSSENLKDEESNNEDEECETKMREMKNDKDI